MEGNLRPIQEISGDIQVEEELIGNLTQDNELIGSLSSDNPELSGTLSGISELEGTLKSESNLSGDLSIAPTDSRDYNRLRNKPSINEVLLEGNKTFEDLGDKPLTNIEIKLIHDRVFGN